MASTGACCSTNTVLCGHHPLRREFPPHMNPNLSPAERQAQLHRYIAERLSPFAPAPHFPAGMPFYPASAQQLTYRQQQTTSSGSQQLPGQYTQQPTPPQLEYLHWLRLCQQQQWELQNRVKKPWYLWAIGVFDLFSGFTGMIYTSSAGLIYTWLMVLGYAAQVVKLIMGIGFLIGLNSDKNSKTVFYTHLWQGCQVFMIGFSVLEISMLVWLNYEPDPDTMESHYVTSLWYTFAWFLSLFFSRVVAFTLVYNFIKNVKHVMEVRRQAEEEFRLEVASTAPVFRDQERHHQPPQQHYPQRQITAQKEALPPQLHHDEMTFAMPSIFRGLSM